MGERPEPEAKADNQGFDFDEASAGFRAAWEDGAEPPPAAAPAVQPSPDVVNPTPLGLGPSTLEPQELAPPAPAQPEPLAIQPVAIAPVQTIDPPASPPDPAPAGSAMKKTMLGIGNPLAAGIGGSSSHHHEWLPRSCCSGGNRRRFPGHHAADDDRPRPSRTGSESARSCATDRATSCAIDPGRSRAHAAPSISTRCFDAALA